MAAVDLSHYGPAIGQLLAEPRLMPLGPGRPSAKARPLLEQLSVEAAFCHAIVRARDMASCCLAGLWLYHDFLDESHQISQDIDTTAGSHWHGIMHRREPDYGNAKYWFRRVGASPVFPALRQSAAELAAREKADAAGFLVRQASWDPFAFIDLAEACGNGRANLEKLCQEIQQREWELLFDHCYRAAVG